MKYRIKIGIWILMTIFLAACGKNVAQQIEEQLQLGQKYLMEMRYDEAIVAFETVISLEPKEFRGYEGLMTAYVETERKEDAEQVLSDGLMVADAIEEWEEDLRLAFLSFVDYAVTYFQGEGQDDVVIILLERRLQLEESDETYRLLIGLYGKTGQVEKLYHLLDGYAGENEEILRDKEDFEFAEAFVQELTELCGTGAIDSLIAIMESEDYAKLVDLIIRLDNPTFFVMEETGLGIYPAGTNKRGDLYYGNYEGDMRSGEGMWLMESRGYYKLARGIWEHDKPNGYQEVIDHSGDDEYYIIYQGNAVDGLWNGSVNLTEIYDWGQDVRTFPVTFDHGRWRILSEEWDGSYMVSEIDNHYVYAIETDELDDLVGVPGFDRSWRGWTD